MLMDELTAQGHQVVEATNGVEGLQSLLDENPDLVLCDRAMPGMSGYDLLEKIRKEHPQYNKVPFVFLTALGDPRDRGSVEHLKPSAYIEKPIDFGKLGTKVFRKGDAFVEAIDTVHNGRNLGKEDVRLLAVFMGADGSQNTVPEPPPQ